MTREKTLRRLEHYMKQGMSKPDALKRLGAAHTDSGQDGVRTGRERMLLSLDTSADATMPVMATAGQAFLGPGLPSVTWRTYKARSRASYRT